MVASASVLSAVTIGVSTERGIVRAVALAEAGDKLSERVVLQCVEQVRGDTKNDLAAAVESALDDLAGKLGADREIIGAAVVYRDAAERRAIVTKLAAGPWHHASLVSAKAAHLALARAMSWVDEFEDLAICEVVAGFQAFSLIDPGRTRVLAAVTLFGGAAGDGAMHAAVTSAWDQFDAAGVKPDAVVLIGSGACESGVVAALESGFGAPVVPCSVAAIAPAIGAALAALPEEEFVGAATERIRRARGSAVLLAAVSVFAGGLVAGGVYATDSGSKTVPEPVLTDARGTVGGPAAEHPAVAPPAAPTEVSTPEADSVPDMGAPFDASSAGTPSTAATPPEESWEQPQDSGDGLTLDPAAVKQSGEASRDDTHSADQAATPQPDAAAAAPQSITPAPAHPAGSPAQSGLFPGEAAPPAMGTPEFSDWWANHWRLTVLWATQSMPKA